MVFQLSHHCNFFVIHPIFIFLSQNFILTCKCFVSRGEFEAFLTGVFIIYYVFILFFWFIMLGKVHSLRSPIFLSLHNSSFDTSNKKLPTLKIDQARRQEGRDGKGRIFSGFSKKKFFRSSLEFRKNR